VTTAGCVADAILAAQDKTFDLLISDLGLPDGNGHDLMAALGKSRGLRGIALSGYGMDSDKADSMAAGFRWHLTKPVDAAQLRRVIDEATR
jgi:CheY-like chemotaxis protein